MSLLTTIRKYSRRVLRQEEDARDRAIADFLQEVPLFGSLSRGMMVELAGAVHVRTYRRDEYLYYEGDPGIGLYIVREGAVRLLVEDPEGVAQEISQMGERRVLGAQCLLGGGVIRRGETAQAMVDTTVHGLFSPEFRTLQRRHPKTAASVAALLARHFAHCLVATRTLLSERDGPVLAATCELQAQERANSQAEPPHAW